MILETVSLKPESYTFQGLGEKQRYYGQNFKLPIIWCFCILFLRLHSNDICSPRATKPKNKNQLRLTPETFSVDIVAVRSKKR